VGENNKVKGRGKTKLIETKLPRTIRGTKIEEGCEIGRGKSRKKKKKRAPPIQERGRARKAISGVERGGPRVHKR